MERPEIMAEQTIWFRRVERFGKSSQKAGHLHHCGKVRSISDDKGPSYTIDCECGVTLGPWQDL